MENPTSTFSIFGSIKSFLVPTPLQGPTNLFLFVQILIFFFFLSSGLEYLIKNECFNAVH